MPTLTITRGLPASGKSTWARAQVAESPATRVRVNRDDLRSMLHNGVYIAHDPDSGAVGTEPTVSAAQRALISKLLARGLDVVCDDTNLSQRTARELRRLAEACCARFEVHDLRGVPLEVCLDRNAQRTGRRRVSDDVIRGMHAKYLAAGVHALPDEAPRERREPYVSPPMAPTAYVVDVDGTVALMGDRDPYDTTTVADDQPNAPVIALVRTLYEAGHTIVFCSGRKDTCRAETETWLAQHLGLPRPLLHMRAADDNRRDSIVKLEMFDQHIRHRYRVLGVLDDRQQVVDAWRSIGLTVFQVAPGEF